MKSILTTTAISAALIAGASTSSFAGNLEADIIPVTPVTVASAARSFPGAFGVASAIPAPSGFGSVALTYADPRGGIAGAKGDGNISASYTLGNPIDFISVTGGININSLAKNFGDSGNLRLSAARMLRAGDSSATFVGASIGKLAGWGDSKNADPTYAGYVSHLTTIGGAGNEFPVQVTAGYRTVNTLSKDGLGALTDGAFLGVAVGVTEALSVSVSGTETQVNVGATVVIPDLKGLSITAGLYDAADTVNRRQTSVTVGYSF